MTYLNLIPAILVIAAYFLGRWVGRGGRDAEVIRLVADNARLKAMLDFTQAECEHVAGLLGEKVSQAHKEIVTAQVDDGAIYWIGDKDVRAASQGNSVFCAECGAFTRVNGPDTVTHAIGCKTGAGWMG